MSAVFRPSALPKIALCPSFQGAQGDAGPHAERGTMADVAFRLAQEGVPILRCNPCGHYFEPPESGGLIGCPACEAGDENVSAEGPLENLDARISALAEKHGIDDKPARSGVEWAIEAMRKEAGEGVRCITDESKLRLDIEGIECGGTADGVAPSVQKGFDLKTGAIRNYLEQMAAYALGFMNQNFATRWRMTLLYMDERKTVDHDFTFDEARNIVLGLRAAHLDPARERRPNGYCGWCQFATECQEQKEAAQRAIEWAGGVDLIQDFEAIRSSPAKLAAFLSSCHALKPFEQIANGIARWRLEEDKPVPGFGLVRVRGIRHVTPESAKRHTKKLPKGEELTVEKVLDAVGELTPFQFKRIMESVNKPLPKSYTKEGRAATYVNATGSRKKDQ